MPRRSGVRSLFDQNLAPRLIHAFAEEYPGSVHVSAAGLERASDRAVAEYALDQGLAVVTKDAREAASTHPLAEVSE